MISTPGINESNGVGKKSPAPVAVAPRTTMRPEWLLVDLAVDQICGADGANGLARAVIGNRQRVIRSGRDRPVAEQQAVGSIVSFCRSRSTRHAKRKRQFDLVAGPEQHRDRQRRAGLARRHIGDADFRAVAKAGSGSRKRSAFGRRASGPSSPRKAERCSENTAAAASTVGRAASDFAAPHRRRRAPCRSAGDRSRSLRLQPRDRLDDLGDLARGSG
jgi:hypothetical protein